MSHSKLVVRSHCSINIRVLCSTVYFISAGWPKVKPFCNLLKLIHVYCNRTIGCFTLPGAQKRCGTSPWISLWGSKIVCHTILLEGWVGNSREYPQPSLKFFHDYHIICSKRTVLPTVYKLTTLQTSVIPGYCSRLALRSERAGTVPAGCGGRPLIPNQMLLYTTRIPPWPWWRGRKAKKTLNWVDGMGYGNKIWCDVLYILCTNICNRLGKKKRIIYLLIFILHSPTHLLPHAVYAYIAGSARLSDC